MNNTYDSIAEQDFYARHQQYLMNPLNRYFPDTFVDTEGTSFKACYDFITHDGIYIEFKAHQLNTSKTKAIAESRLETQLWFCQQGTENYQQLKYAWNHSIYKHAIIAKEYGSNYQLVFKDGIKLSTQSKNKMNALSINWCFESELFSSAEPAMIH